METIWINFDETIRGAHRDGPIISLAGLYVDAREIMLINVGGMMQNDACYMDIVRRDNQHIKICSDVTAQGHINDRTKTVRSYPQDEEGCPICLRDFQKASNEFATQWSEYINQNKESSNNGSPTV